MQLELLVSCVNADIPKLIHKMNIETDAIIVNQCDKYEVESYEVNAVKTDQSLGKPRKITAFHMKERGVGLSRNHALMRATKDFALFSDEDIEYESGYEQMIVDEFLAHPKADAILFQVDVDESRRTYHNQKFGRVGLLTCGRYPAYSMAFSTSKLHKSGVSFTLLFGGGARFSNGEDSLFIRECITKGMRVYKSPVKIGTEIPRPSTWFTGYNRKFFVDRGVLFHFLYGKMAIIWAVRFAFFKRKEMCQDIPWKDALGLVLLGIEEGKKL